MAPSIDGELVVATCIACGARSRAGDCPDGCVDVALDLVDAAAVEADEARVETLRRRVRALRTVAEAVAGEDGGLDALRASAREALQMPVADAPAEVEIVEAWGCPVCGRIDAPQPCLGVCIREPVLMVDAARYRALADEAAALTATDAALTAVVRLTAQVRPRPGQEDATREALRARARAALAAASETG